MSDAKQPPRDDFSAADDVVAGVLRHEQDEGDIAPPTRWQKILARMVTSRELVTLAVVIILFLFFTAGNPRFASVNILIGIARRGKGRSPAEEPSNPVASLAEVLNLDESS